MLQTLNEWPLPPAFNDKSAMHKKSSEEARRSKEKQEIIFIVNNDIEKKSVECNTTTASALSSSSSYAPLPCNDAGADEREAGTNHNPLVLNDNNERRSIILNDETNESDNVESGKNARTPRPKKAPAAVHARCSMPKDQ